MKIEQIADDAPPTQDTEHSTLLPSRTIIPRRKVISQVLADGVPMALSFTFSFSLAAIGVMSGRLAGDTVDNVAAANLMASYINTVVVCSLAPLFAIGFVASQARGNLIRLEQEALAGIDHTNEIRRSINYISAVVRNGALIATCIVSLPLLTMIFSNRILASPFGQPLKIVNLAYAYLFPFAFAAPALLMRHSFEQVMFAFEKQIPAMAIGLVSFAFGTGLSVLLSQGYLGFPRLGFSGIAIGYVTEAYITSITFALFLGLNTAFKRFNFFHRCAACRENLQQLLPLIKTGLPIAATIIAEVIASLFTSTMAGWHGTQALAAQSLAGQLTFFTLIPLIAFSLAVAQQVSRAIGKQEYLNAVRTSRYGLLTVIGAISPICLAVVIAPSALEYVVANPGNIDQIVLDLSRVLIRITALGVALDATRYCALQTLRAVNDNLVPSVISIGNTCLGTLLGYILGFKTELGIYGVTAGPVIGLGLNAAALLVRMVRNLVPSKLAPTPVAAAAQSESGLLSKCLGYCSSLFSRKPQSSQMATLPTSSPSATVSITM